MRFDLPRFNQKTIFIDGREILIDMEFDKLTMKEKDSTKYTPLAMSFYTDFCTIGGARERCIYRDENQEIHSAPLYWNGTKEISKKYKNENDVIAFDTISYWDEHSKTIGVRPCLHYNEGSNKLITNIGDRFFIYKLDIDYDKQTFEFGEYPQSLLPKEENKKMEQLFNLGQYIKTGKKYTYKNQKIDELIIDNKKVVRLVFEYADGEEHSKISRNQNYYHGMICYVEVTPIKWIMINDTKAISKNILFASELYDENNHNVVLDYLTNEFPNEIVPSNLFEADKEDLYLLCQKLMKLINNLEKRNQEISANYKETLKAVKQILEGSKQILENVENAENENSGFTKKLNKNN